MPFDIEKISADKEYRDELRHRCLTDHLFLGQVLGKGFNKLIESVHRPSANLYVKKKPGLPIEDQDTVKNMIDLEPRETYKTTLGILDSIQWIGLDPDITILNEGATQPLAKAISNVMIAQFVKQKTRPPTAFQAIFTDYCVEKAYDGSYYAPGRTYEQVDATVATTSVQTSQAGFHPWIFNADDAVDTDNSGIHAKPENRQKVISNHDTNINTRRRGGYFHARGTRYHPFELWGRLLEDAKKAPHAWRVMVRSALKLKFNLRLVAGEPFPSQDDIEILYPGIITYDEMKQKFEANFESFMCQQMNDPQGGGLQIITGDLYAQCLVEDVRKFPSFGEVQIFWRPMYAGKDFMTYAEGAAARIVGGKVYIIDAWRGMYTPSGFYKKVIDVCKRHQTGALAIEQVPGWEMIQTNLKNEAARQNRPVRIEWIPFEEDDLARGNRMKQMEPMMHTGRLQIAANTGQAPELHRQFVHFGMILENGLIDAVSRLALRIPVSVVQDELDREEVESYRRAQNRMMADFIFSHGGRQVIEEAVTAEHIEQNAPKPNRGYPGLPDILGGLDG